MKRRWTEDLTFSGRIFLANKANERFLSGDSRMTAQQRTTLEWAFGVLCLTLLVGFVITSEHGTQAKVARRLKENGRSTQATIVKKEATSSGQARDFCYITYQFHAPATPTPSAPEVTFGNKVEVSDHFFDSTREGQSVLVVYDPGDPSVSMLDASIRFPRSPTWLIWTWWIGCGLALGLLFQSYFAHARLSLKGKLIRGRIVALAVHGQSEKSPVEIRFAFDSPTGSKIESTVRKETKVTNLLGVSPRFAVNDAVAVLYVTDKVFLLL